MRKCERFACEVVLAKRPETGPGVNKPLCSKPKIQAWISREKTKGSSLFLFHIAEFAEPPVRFHFRRVMGGIGPVGIVVRGVSRIAFPEDHPEGTAKEIGRASCRKELRM